MIPYEVRDEVAATEWSSRPHHFRDPNPDDSTGAQAKAEFNRLRDIKRDAVASHLLQRHEDGWKNLVYTPLLQLAFGSRRLERNEIENVNVQCELAMSATIAGDSIPFLHRRSAGARSEPACSVYLEGRVLDSEDGSYAGSDVSIFMLQSRGGKVDYAVVVGIPVDDPLGKTISHLLCRTEGLPLVNQTAYLPLADSPIAVSIKTGFGDTMVQLGIWTVAWYQRMYNLREALVGAGPKP